MGIKHITLIRREGDYETVDKPVKVKTFAEASQVMARWAQNARCDKVEFTVEFENGTHYADGSSVPERLSYRTTCLRKEDHSDGFNIRKAILRRHYNRFRDFQEVIAFWESLDDGGTVPDAEHNIMAWGDEWVTIDELERRIAALESVLRPLIQGLPAVENLEDERPLMVASFDERPLLLANGDDLTLGHLRQAAKILNKEK